jgi:hypothetical protein
MKRRYPRRHPESRRDGAPVEFPARPAFRRNTHLFEVRADGS